MTGPIGQGDGADPAFRRMQARPEPPGGSKGRKIMTTSTDLTTARLHALALLRAEPVVTLDVELTADPPKLAEVSAGPPHGRWSAGLPHSGL